MVYVDLNPIRAAIAATAETSDFTSVKERIVDRQAAAQKAIVESAGETAANLDVPPKTEADWLAPIPLETSANTVQEPSVGRRASDKGCLPMSLDDYLGLVDWTGRQIRKDKTGKISEECLPIFQRLRCDGETWMDWVRNFRQRFRNEVGRPASCQAFKAALHHRRATLTSS